MSNQDPKDPNFQEKIPELKKVEYALRDFNKPIGVAGYEITLVETLSKELKESLPTIEDIEAEFGKE